MFRVKINDLTSLQSCAINLPSKMIFELRGQNTTWQEMLTSFWCRKAESIKAGKRQRGRYCVAGAPNQQSCQNRSFTPGIRMYKFPKDPVVRSKWVQFVRRHRHDFKDPTSAYTSLCSAHFEESCFAKNLAVLSSMEAQGLKRLKWIGAWREMLCQPGSDYILFRQLRRRLAIAGKDKWDFHLF